MSLHLSWQVLWQRTPRWFCFRSSLGRFGRRTLDRVRPLLRGLGLLQIFQPQFQLFDLPVEFL